MIFCTECQGRVGIDVDCPHSDSTWIFSDVPTPVIRPAEEVWAPEPEDLPERAAKLGRDLPLVDRLRGIDGVIATRADLREAAEEIERLRDVLTETKRLARQALKDAYRDGRRAALAEDDALGEMFAEALYEAGFAPDAPDRHEAMYGTNWAKVGEALDSYEASRRQLKD